MSLTLPRSPERVQRLVLDERLITTAAVTRVNRVDGRSRVLAIRTRDGWRGTGDLPLTAESVRVLREQRVLELILRRGLRSARLPIGWIRIPG